MSSKFDYEELTKSINENRVPTACPNCGIPSTSICTILNVPHFRELLMMLFNCDNCGYRDNDIKGNGILQPEGVKFVLQVQKLDDLNRQIVLSTFSAVTIVDIEFEFPRSTDRSVITTIEGLLNSAISDLSEYYKQLTTESNNVASNETILKLLDVINTLRDYTTGDNQFKLILDDPSGNSYIEQLPNTSNLQKIHYQRTDQQTKAMGYSTLGDNGVDRENYNCNNSSKSNTLDLNRPLEDDYEPPLFELQTACPDCGNNGSNKICQVQVPGFRECIIFSFTCGDCGAKSTEVKPGGPIGDFGQKWYSKDYNLGN